MQEQQDYDLFHLIIMMMMMMMGIIFIWDDHSEVNHHHQREGKHDWSNEWNTADTMQ